MQQKEETAKTEKQDEGTLEVSVKIKTPNKKEKTQD